MRKIEVITSGRTDLNEFFAIGPLSSLKHQPKFKLNQTPLLLFVAGADQVEVRIVQRPADIMGDASIPDGTQVMSQWPGQWSSDFFQFTVGDIRREFGSSKPNQL